MGLKKLRVAKHFPDFLRIHIIHQFENNHDTNVQQTCPLAFPPMTPVLSHIFSTFNHHKTSSLGPQTDAPARQQRRSRDIAEHSQSREKSPSVVKKLRTAALYTPPFRETWMPWRRHKRHLFVKAALAFAVFHVTFSAPVPPDVI